MESKVSKKICTGCGACFNICPKGAIEMKENKEGFLFPVINKDLCVNCGMCEKVCPAINPVEKFPAKEKVYAMKADEELRMKSSSGGVFSLLANQILEEYGFVCGVAFSDDFMKVEHIVISDKKDLYKLRTSKYVQSDTGKVYSQIKELLDSGKKVLFSGTPCQIAGIKSFLGHDYENLLTVEILCHGAPSPMVWREYLKEISEGQKVKYVNFRLKKKYNFKMQIQSLGILLENNKKIEKTIKKSPYYLAFGECLIIRRCCENCCYTTPQRCSDITLADFWGVKYFDKSLDDSKGVSLCIANTHRGEYSLSRIESVLKMSVDMPMKYAIMSNINLSKPSKIHKARNTFFNNLKKEESMSRQLEKSLKEDKYDGIIVNFWDAPGNYGAMLTAWALQRYFKNKGYDYRLLSYDYNKKRRKYKKSCNYYFAQKYLNLSDRVNSVNDFKKLQNKVDNFVVGSDQVFRDYFLRKRIPYFLFSTTDFESRRVAFSASFGSDRFNACDEDIKIYQKLFKRFDALSTREDSGVEIFKNTFGLNAEHIFDPVFLVNKSEWDMFINKDDETYKNTIVCYFFKGNEKIMNAVKQFADSKNLKVVNFAESNRPTEEFLTALYNATYVFCDSFHGTCFAILFHKNFCSITSSTGGQARFTSLINTFGLEKHLVEKVEDVDFNNIEIESSIWENVDKIIEKEQKKADDWFNKVFETPNIKTNLQLQNEISLMKQKDIKLSNDLMKNGVLDMLFSVKKVDKLIIVRIFGIKLSFKRG